MHAAHPDWNTRFLNAGVGGDRVTGGYAGTIDRRLDRDVIAHNPSVVAIMLGMNDRSTAETREAFPAGYRHILQRLKKALPQARITVIGPSPIDDVTRPDPTSRNADLSSMSGFLQGLAAEQSALFVDLNLPGIAGLKRLVSFNPFAATLAIPDRVHPNPSFHLLMADTLLRAWNFPEILENIDLDQREATKTETSDALHATDLVWHRQTNSAWDPFQPNDANEAMNRVLEAQPHVGRGLLRISGLPDGSYALRVDDRIVGGLLSAAQLQAGIDLSSFASPLRDQAKTIFYACSSEQQQQVMRTPMLSEGEKVRSASGDLQLDLSWDTYMRHTSEQCRSAAAPAEHTFLIRRQSGTD